ncbi:MAG: CBS domain-containing protein [Candidatus Heimdallarchaeota archaeon]|nr:CBS domain-containing protein [Candidatus Heimdallarchaeota archaeon]
MQIFLDTLDLSLIKYYYNLGIITGVTSNPTFQRRFDMKDDIAMVEKIRHVMPHGEIHVEAVGNTKEEIISNANRILKCTKDESLVFKIPFSEEGIGAVGNLSHQEIETSLHLVYSVNQAMLAAYAGATYICPLLGRLDDVGHDAIENIGLIQEAYLEQEEHTKIMASSVRYPQHVSKIYVLGIDAVTIPPSILNAMFYHPLTQTGTKTFWEDYNSLKLISQTHIHEELLIDEEATVSDCLSLMVREKAGAVIIVDKIGKLKGIFTAGDLKRACFTKRLEVTDNIKRHLGSYPIVIEFNETIAEAKASMKKFNIESLVVIKDDYPIGLLTLRDML